MSTMICLNDAARSIFRKTYNATRLKLIQITRFLFDNENVGSTHGKVVILNLQYVNAFTEVDMLCGVALKKQGYTVKTIVCPGLEYCEREDYQTKRPDCSVCRKESLDLCSAYGFEVLKPKKNLKKYYFENYSKRLKTPVNELIFRNYVHFKKGFDELDYVTWERIKSSILELIDYISDLDYEFKNVEKIITANGRFFQTALPIELIKTKSGFITTEVFSDKKIVFGRNSFSLNNELEVTQDELRKLPYDKGYAKGFIKNEGRLTDGNIQVWGKNRIEDVEVIKDTLKTNQYDEILAFFPNVIWDSTWFGLGHFCHSPATFISTLNSLANRFPKILFVVRAHPAEVNVPKEMRSSSSIFSDLSCRYVKFAPNVVFIEAESELSSYKLADIADYIVLWNGTLGLELAARGKSVYSIAKAYYENFGIVKKIENVAVLEKVLANKEKFHPDEQGLENASRILYTSRNLKRVRSPIHLSTFCTKFLWNEFSRKEQNFVKHFPSYFEDNISFYELISTLDK